MTKPSPILRPAAQYLRMSTEHQRYSLANQAAAISAYAESEGYQIIKTYADAARSGLTTRRRSSLNRLLADVIAGQVPFDTILVLDISRWGRFQDADEGGHYEFLCRAAGVQVVYSGEQFGEGLDGSVHKHIKRVMAAEYSRELSTKVRASRDRCAKAGLVLGGTCLYGLARQIIYPDGTLGRLLERGERKSRPEHSLQMAPEGPEQSSTLREIFRLFVKAQLPPDRIADRLNAEGSSWIGGAPWTRVRVARVLRCELVVGRQPYGKTTCVLGQRPRYNPHESWGSVAIFPPIVSPRIFKAAQVRLQALDGRTKTDGEMLDDLRAIHARHGRVNVRLINATPGTLKACVYFKRFGGLWKACERIGLTCVRRERGTRPDGSRLSRDEVLDRIRRLHAASGGIGWSIYRTDNTLPARAWIQKEFGGLRQAVEAAGLDYSPRRRWTRNSFDRQESVVIRARDAGVRLHAGPRGGLYTITSGGKRRYWV